MPSTMPPLNNSRRKWLDLVEQGADETDVRTLVREARRSGRR